MAYLLICFLLIGSAFFSGTEIAYTSLSKLKMKRDCEHPTTAQKLVGFIYNHYDYALSTVLVFLLHIAVDVAQLQAAVQVHHVIDGRVEGYSINHSGPVSFTTVNSRYFSSGNRLVMMAPRPMSQMPEA